MPRHAHTRSLNPGAAAISSKVAGSAGQQRHLNSASRVVMQDRLSLPAPAIWDGHGRLRVTDKPDRVAMAYHEAGHAVIARVQGIECVQVVMFSPIDGLAAGTQTTKATWLAIDADPATLLGAIKKDIVVSLAGPCGEMKYRNKPWHQKYFKRWVSDFKSARDRARYAALVATGADRSSGSHHPTADQIAIADKLPVHCLDIATYLVNTHWPAIERVARVLIVRDMLDQAELDCLIAEAE
jgi:hypothetical protein